jgi:acyl-CoA synthetase (AMP-forming)/AMP-acid ligase II
MTAQIGFAVLSAGIIPVTLNVKLTLKVKTNKEALDFILCTSNQLRHNKWIPATVAINNNTRQVTDTVPLQNNRITKCPACQAHEPRCCRRDLAAAWMRQRFNAKKIFYPVTKTDFVTYL